MNVAMARSMSLKMPRSEVCTWSALMVTLQFNSWAASNAGSNRKKRSARLRLMKLQDGVNNIARDCLFGFHIVQAGFLCTAEDLNFVGGFAKPVAIVVERIQDNEVKVFRGQFLHGVV